MKRLFVFVVYAGLCVLFTSCDGWKMGERELIMKSPEVMRVLSIDDDADAKVLRQECRDLSVRELKSDIYDTLCRKMLATVTDPAQDGVGIAGPQVGIARRIVAVQRYDKFGFPFEIYPNVRITQRRGDLVSDSEGCLSIPGRYGKVFRSRDITISYTSPESLRDTSEDVSGFTAVIFQHECDHLDGIVFTDRIWERSDSWYNGGAAASDITAPADVFCLVSTAVTASFDPLGNEVFNATLTPGELVEVDRELSFEKKNMFGDSLNFYSPRYHLITMNGFYRENYRENFDFARHEVLDAFDYYIRHINNGRPFFLAGFSQGAMMVLEILKHMGEDAHSRMLAAYAIGYGIDSGTASYPYVRPASGPYDTGAVYSFNTVTDTSAIWQLVYNNSVCCINPVNWRTDSTPATFEYEGQQVTVSVDAQKNVIISSAYTDPRTGDEVSGCMHHEDLMFYTPFIRRNALDRVYSPSSASQR